MILDHIASYANRPHQPVSDNALSRRNFLRAGAAAGGGLVLSLSFANREAEAAANDFAPNAFISVGTDGQIVLTMPYVEMGCRHLHLHPNVDRRRA